MVSPVFSQSSATFASRSHENESQATHTGMISRVANFFLLSIFFSVYDTKTSCAKAIAEWEATNEEKAADAEVVKLYAKNPPIQKLDNSLNDLVNCKQLSLSTNSIDRMTALSGMKSLEILSMGRNCLKRIEKLEDNKDTIKELWLSYNMIASLDGLDGLSNLEVFVHVE